MENPSTFWNLAFFVVALIALVIIGVLIARIRRAHAARVPVRVAESAPPENTEEELDSSHIGFAPLVNSPVQPAPADAGTRPSGEDVGGARR
jgi:hypothetical protein